MRLRMTVSALLLCCISGAVAQPAAPQLDLLWQIEGLSSPESVALSADGAFLYVSNVNGEGDERDGNGFISRIGVDGEILEREWATGLNGPKGIALAGGALFVSDIDQVVIIDASTGKITQTIPVPGAQFLNDIAVLEDGTVLVADSANARISMISDGHVSVWTEDALLESVNGLLPETNGVTVTTMAGRLLSIDYETRAIRILAEGLGDGDGVAPLAGGRYLVTEWPGILHEVRPDGSNIILLDSRQERRFLNDILLVGDTLYVPHWIPGGMSAYRVNDIP